MSTTSARIRLPFAVHRQTGRAVHIGQVENGRSCDCLCPECGAPLIARQGVIQTHHFAHDRGADCAAGYETALHLFAKETIARHKRLALPAAGDRAARTVTFDEVLLEQWDRTTRRVPDLIGRIGRHECWIEVAVTHFAPVEKIELLRKHGRKTVELDLSGLPKTVTLSCVERVVLHDAPRSWLYHPAVDLANEKAARVAARQAREEAKRSEEEEAARREAEAQGSRLSRAISVLRGVDPPLPGEGRKAKARQRIEREGWASVFHAYPFPQQFTQHHTDWQAALICRHLDGLPKASVQDHTVRLEREGVVHPALVDIEDLLVPLRYAMSLIYWTPWEVIDDFLARIADHARRRTFFEAAADAGFNRIVIMEADGTSLYGLDLSAADNMEGAVVGVVFEVGVVTLRTPNLINEGLALGTEEFDRRKGAFASVAARLEQSTKSKVATVGDLVVSRFSRTADSVPSRLDFVQQYD